MSKVTFNQNGYYGSSMSENAVLAYENGERPKSKWTKAAMLAAMRDYCEDAGFELPAEIEKMTKADLFEKFFEWESWHHTGRYANETDFYAIDEEAVWELAPKDVQDHAEAERQRILAEEEARDEKIRQAARDAMPQWAKDAQAHAGITRGLQVPLLDKIEHEGWEVEVITSEAGRVQEVYVHTDKITLAYASLSEMATKRIAWDF